MSGLFGFVRFAGAADPNGLGRMAASLRRHAGQVVQCASLGPIHIGFMSRDPVSARGWHALSASGHVAVWVAGEVFSTRHPLEDAELPDVSRWLSSLATGLERCGARALTGLNGDFQVVWWDARSQQVHLAVDRFATSALYYATRGETFTFAYGVRGVLSALPGPVSADGEAIREAVTFGGYRLGSRTNVVGVTAVRPAEVITRSRDGIVTSAPYWRWQDVPQAGARTVDEAADALQASWRRAIQRRLHGTASPGQTLSGGRDSRAVLAEAAPQAPSWQSFTYGVPGCDDARYAGMAAAAAGVEWRFLPLYEYGRRDWLQRRSEEVQHVDGLIDLGDLMHLEALEVLTEKVDCHVPGFIGDAIVGTTFDHVDTIEAAMITMSYTGSELGLSWDEAHSRVMATAPAAAGDPRALLYQHKIAQAIARPNAALAAWIAVRRPFLDLDVIDVTIGLPHALRARLYDHWVRREYPKLFRRIPVQKTGVPAGSSPARVLAARAGRVLRRQVRGAAAAVGWPVRPWSRGYTADEREWSRPAARARIEATILRPDSIACELWGRARVREVVDRWMDGRGGSSKVIGALYSYESYHRDLPAFLREKGREVA